jgi:hypothetical protein
LAAQPLAAQPLAAQPSAIVFACIYVLLAQLRLLAQHLLALLALRFAWYIYVSAHPDPVSYTSVSVSESDPFLLYIIEL